jgi:hypothetical protein
MFLPLQAMVNKRPGHLNQSNRRAPGGIPSLRLQGKTRNRMAADHMNGKARRKGGPAIRNLHPVPRHPNIKTIPAADRTTAPATMGTTGRH